MPGDGLFDLLHGVGLDPGDDVVHPVDDVDFPDVCYLPELLQEILFGPKVSINKYKGLRNFGSLPRPLLF